MKKVSYIMAVAFAFFVFSISSLNATSVEYNYLNDYVASNHKSEFFGDNGYLETIRNSLLDYKQEYFNSGSYHYFNFSIFFTDDDIFVIAYRRNSGGSQFHNDINYCINYVNDISNVYINAIFDTTDNGWSLSMFRLSDYSSVGDLISTIKGSYSTAFDSGKQLFYHLSHGSTNYDLRYSSFNFFDTDIDYFAIPYYTSSSYGFKAKFTQSCGSLSDSGFISINGTNYSSGDSIPSYYDLYGDIEPFSFANVDYINVGSINFEFDKEDFSSGSYNISFFVLNDISSLNIRSFHYLGLVNDNGLYHWEPINESCYIYNGIEQNGNSCMTATEELTISNKFVNLDFYSYGAYNLDNYEKVQVILEFDNIYIIPSTIKKSSNNIVVNDIFSSDYVVFQYINWNTVDSTFFTVSSDFTFGGANLFAYEKQWNSSYTHNISVFNLENLSTDFPNANSLCCSKTLDYFSVNGLTNNFISLSGTIGPSSSTGLFTSYDYDALSINYSRDLLIVYSPVDYYDDTNFIYYYTGLVNKNAVDFVGVDSNGNRINYTFNHNFSSSNAYKTYNSFTNFFKTGLSSAKSFLDCGIEILSLVTSFYFSLDNSVQAILLIIFIIGAITIFIRSIV